MGRNPEARHCRSCRAAEIVQNPRGDIAAHQSVYRAFARLKPDTGVCRFPRTTILPGDAWHCSRISIPRVQMTICGLRFSIARRGLSKSAFRYRVPTNAFGDFAFTALRRQQ